MAEKFYNGRIISDGREKYYYFQIPSNDERFSFITVCQIVTSNFTVDLVNEICYHGTLYNIFMELNE